MTNNKADNSHRKQVVGKLKSLCSNNRQWDAFCEYLDIIVSEHHRKLEQSDNIVSIHQAQGAVQALRALKYLRDEALANG
jgi:hypothetical protein